MSGLLVAASAAVDRAASSLPDVEESFAQSDVVDTVHRGYDAAKDSANRIVDGARSLARRGIAAVKGFCNGASQKAVGVFYDTLKTDWDADKLITSSGTVTPKKDWKFSNWWNGEYQIRGNHGVAKNIIRESDSWDLSNETLDELTTVANKLEQLAGKIEKANGWWTTFKNKFRKNPIIAPQLHAPLKNIRKAIRDQTSSIINRPDNKKTKDELLAELTMLTSLQKKYGEKYPSLHTAVAKVRGELLRLDTQKASVGTIIVVQAADASAFTRIGNWVRLKFS